MNIWRVKSKTGKTVHLTSDREGTFCNREIKDDWKFVYLLRDRPEAFEQVENLCSKCNEDNIQEWEKEFVHEPDENLEQRDSERVDTTERVEEKPAKGVKADEVRGLGTW